VPRRMRARNSSVSGIYMSMKCLTSFIIIITKVPLALEAQMRTHIGMYTKVGEEGVRSCRSRVSCTCGRARHDADQATWACAARGLRGTSAGRIASQETRMQRREAHAGVLVVRQGRKTLSCKRLPVFTALFRAGRTALIPATCRGRLAAT